VFRVRIKMRIKFKQIESKSIKEIEFVADFTGSEYIKIELGGGAAFDAQTAHNAGGNKMIVKKEIGPKRTEVIAEVRLMKNWRLKSKFRFTLKNPSLEKQKEYLGDRIREHLERVDKAKKIYA